MKNQALYSSKDKRKIKCLLLQFVFGTLRVKKNLELKRLERNRMDKSGYKFFPEPGVVLLQGIIFSLSGRKFYPVKVSSQITVVEEPYPYQSVTFEFILIYFIIVKVSKAI